MVLLKFAKDDQQYTPPALLPSLPLMVQWVKVPKERTQRTPSLSTLARMMQFVKLGEDDSAYIPPWELSMIWQFMKSGEEDWQEIPPP